jgi:hypothetical protein
VLEPNNLTRRVYGFDSFGGFPTISAADEPAATGVAVGDLAASPSSESELRLLMELFDLDRFLGHVPKMDLISGDVMETLPDFLDAHPHLVVSLLFLDFDLYEPTRLAIDLLLPRMPKGAVIAFDELDNPLWPGETRAVMEFPGLNALRIQRFPFDPYIGYARIE